MKSYSLECFLNLIQKTDKKMGGQVLPDPRRSTLHTPFLLTALKRGSRHIPHIGYEWGWPWLALGLI